MCLVREVFDAHRIMGQGEGRDFTLAFPHKEWFRGIFWTRPSGTVIFGDHATLSPQSGWSPNGRMFVMLREPSSRAARQKWGAGFFTGNRSPYDIAHTALPVGPQTYPKPSGLLNYMRTYATQSSCSDPALSEAVAPLCHLPPASHRMSYTRTLCSYYRYA